MSASQTDICRKTYTLNNGLKLPAVGLGTWQGQIGGTSDAEALRDSIIHALRSGYRLIDTAQYYGIESVVGEAIRSSGVQREDITVVTKFWGFYHHDPNISLQASLKALDIGYIDLFLMHWPPGMTPEGVPTGINESPTFVETWKKMEAMVGDSCRSIGVCNFTQKTLGALLEECTITPAVNQVELHAHNPNLNLVPYCQDRGIHVMAWSTLGSEMLGDKNQILRHPFFVNMGNKYGCSTGVVSLSWAVQRGLTIIPKSSSLKRIESNIRLVELSNEDIEAINFIHREIGQLRLSAITPGLIYKNVSGKDTILGWSKVDFGWEDESGNWLT